MTNNQKRQRRTAVRGLRSALPTFLLLVGAKPAFAGITTVGTITFSSASVAAVPTMGSIALLLLSGLLAVIAMKSYRKAGGITPAIVGLLGVAALASTGSIQLVQDARAQITPIPVEEPGEKPVVNSLNTFRNVSGSELRVEDLELDEGFRVDSNPTEDPSCSVGAVIGNGEQCSVSITTNPVP